ncbi:hypothetical protein [Mariprofundus ferrooxydans]|uniref:hypothetical protein n=1 Tax=Mariprofundus ferrooxydans TaxID=314344 RepID=UPI001431500B|nr:hypothetical protein [Mariprofundus ferrooxydans]
MAATPITVKIPNQLLEQIEHTQSKSSLSRHAVILRLIHLGYKCKRMIHQITLEKQALEETVQLARRNGILTGACYTIAIIAVLFVALLTVIKV